MARYVKMLSGAVDDAHRKEITNELRQIYTRNAAAIREHRKQHGAPGTQGKGHQMGGDEPKKGKKSERLRSRTPAASSSGPALSSSTPAAFRGTARRLD